MRTFVRPRSGRLGEWKRASGAGAGAGAGSSERELNFIVPKARSTMHGSRITPPSLRMTRTALPGILIIGLAAVVGGAEPQDAPKPALPKPIEKAAPKVEEKQADTKQEAP